MRHKPKILSRDATGFGDRLEKKVTAAPSLALDKRKRPSARAERLPEEEKPKSPERSATSEASPTEPIQQPQDDNVADELAYVKVILTVPDKLAAEVAALKNDTSITDKAIASVFLDVWRAVQKTKEAVFEASNKPKLTGNRLSEISLPLPARYLNQFAKERDPLRATKKATIAYAVLSPMYDDLWGKTLTEIKKRISQS